MAATGTKFDRRSTVEAQICACVRQLLLELGGSRGIEELTARGGTAHLERELGLGSLERVELLLRLDEACGVRLPDHVVAEADTVQDLVAAILKANTDGATPAARASPPQISVSAAAPPLEISDVRHKIDAEIDRAESLTEIIRLRGLAEPARAHIQLYEDGEAPREITFGELFARASAVAEALVRRGFEPGQTAAIMLPTCAEFFFTFAGILLAGGIPVPIYPPFRADRIAEYATRQSAILRNAEVRFLFTFRQAEGLARLLRPRVPSLREVVNAARFAEFSPAGDESHAAGWRPVRILGHHARGEDIAFLQYTSGSTGDPKGVTLTHSNLLANIRAIVEALELTPQDVCVSWLPLYHDMGLIGAWLAPIFTGIPLVVMSPLAFLSRPERWLRAISRHRGTISPAPNFAYELCMRKIAEKDLQGVDLSSWRAAINGAETVRPETLERFVARFAPYGFRREAMLPVYGLAEATLAVSLPKMGAGYRVDRIERDSFESRGQAVTSTAKASAAEGSAALAFVGAGRPLQNMEVRIAGADGTALPERTEGQLWFRGPSATSGYYRNPAATGQLAREDAWLNSGDLAYQSDGELFITGRAKDLIIKGGRNIYPHEVEEVAGRVAGVRAGCVVAFGAPDERSGTERLVVAAEVRDSSMSQAITAEIVRTVDEALGMPPDVVALLPMQSIPKTSSGKLRRGETRRLYLEGRLGKKRPPGWMQFARLAAQQSPLRVWSWMRRGIRRSFEFAYGVYALAAVSLVLIPLWILVSFTRERLRAARMAHLGSRLMLFFAGVPIRFEGHEVLAGLSASGPWIFAPNHSSYIDVLIALACLPPGVRFVAKSEVLEMPLFGKIARRSGQFGFDRGDPQARIRQAEEVEAALRRGDSVGIYPEGTFTSASGIRPFQLGAFKSAAETQRPVCPVAVRGAREILRDGTFLPRPGKITVTFGPLLYPDPAAQGAWQEIVRLRDAAREIIARHTGEPLL
ncbi:MAG: AMP-binding protein [Candidatus Acidiferrales bacterium]